MIFNICVCDRSNHRSIEIKQEQINALNRIQQRRLFIGIGRRVLWQFVAV